jgi:hypothetical protein
MSKFKETIAEYLKDNPDLVTYLKGAAIGAAVAIVVGTIVEDFLTAGAGILDDWQPGINLKWEYYMRSVGKPLLDADDVHTYCNLYCNIDDVPGDSAESVFINIYAVMLPDNSWVTVKWSSMDKDFKQEMNNDSLLAYQQLHFDIAELVARQLRRDLSLVILPRDKYREKIKVMLDKAADTLIKMRQQFDDEVKHNPISPQLVVWQQDIAQKLTALNPYTKHTVEVDIR